MTSGPHQPQPQQYLGVTPPISLATPTVREQQATDALIDCLRRFNVFELDDESRTREMVLAKLNVIVKDFVRRISLARNLPEAVANEAGGKIFTFGSYRLGVHGAGADIDTLCVVPRYVQREDFFTDLFETLKAIPEVTELTAVPDSYVPVMKMCFEGIPIDLVFARLVLSSVPDNLELRDDNLLKNLDERCVRSLNGTNHVDAYFILTGSRVTDEILRLVPSIPTFRTALRCIKLWSKRRATYSNVMGFLGGVAWAMMVARVCQLYPNATAAVVVAKFFRIMGKWNWPQPVLLKPIDEGPLQVRVWNPRMYPADRAHRMPVITPAYPSMCATHNVTESTLRIIMDELNRAADITDRVLIGTAQWDELFEKHDFFHRYKYYLQVIASSDSIDNQRIWSALVESRLRHLVLKLEYVENLQIAHPFIKGFEKVINCTTDEEAIDAGRGIYYANSQDAASVDDIALQESNSIENKDESKSSQQQTEENDTSIYRVVHTTTFYIGLAVEPRDSGATAPRKLDISWPTSEFTKLCKSWEKYDEKSMGICVKYIKSSALPNDVFDEGELRLRLKRGKTKQARNSLNGQPTDNPFKKRRSQEKNEETTESWVDQTEHHDSKDQIADTDAGQ